MRRFCTTPPCNSDWNFLEGVNVYISEGLDRVPAIEKEKQEMKRIRLLAAIAGVTALVALAAACGNGDSEPTAGSGSESAGGGVTRTSGGSSAVGLSQLAQAFSGVTGGVAGGQAGIWVTGEGSITMEPDLALLNLGVETDAETVKEAREEAANAMTAVIDALKARGVADIDIQTRSFNIFPQYDFVEVIKDGRRTGQQVLVGYRVSNTAVAKLRDLDGVGEAIDAVADAGGNAIRINGISFSVEDTKPLTVNLRADAVADALAKAEQFANLTGVVLGRLVFITEVGRVTPVAPQFAQRGFALEAAAAPSPIGGGELEIRMSVQVVFEIQ